MKRILLYFLQLCLAIAMVGAQGFQDVRLKQLTVQEGLPDNNVKCMAQDELGYLWIGTEYGLCRYDGNKFSAYYKNKAPLHLPGNTINHLKYLGNDLLGISTPEGFQLLNTKTFAYTNLKIADTGRFSIYQNNTWDCALLPDNKTAITTSTGFYVFNKNGDLDFRYDYYKEADFNKRMIWGQEIYKAGANRYVIIGHQNSYAVYNESKKTIQLFSEDDGKKKEWPFLADKEWRRIRISETELLMANQQTDSVFYMSFITGKSKTRKLGFPVLGNLSWNAKARWLTDTSMLVNIISGGVVKLIAHPKTKEIQTEKTRVAKHLRPYSHFIDNEQRLWIGTTNGLYQQRIKPATIRQVPITNFLSEDNTVATAFSYQHKTYVGCLSKLGFPLLVYNKNCDSLLAEFSFYDKKSDWNEVNSINSYSADTLLLGTRAGVLWFNTKNHRYGKYEPHVPNSDFFKNAYIQLCNADTNGWAWLLPNHSSEAARYNVRTKELVVYTNNGKPVLPITDVKHITRDTYGNTWIGGKGLCRFNEQTEVFDTLISVFAGSNKYSNNVTNLCADNNGGLWIQTANNDLLKLDIKQHTYNVYNGSVGYPEGITHATAFSPNNNLLILQSGRLVEYSISKKAYQLTGITDNLPQEKPLSETTIYFDSSGQRFFLFFPKTMAIYTPMAGYNSLSAGLLIEKILINNTTPIYHPKARVNLRYKQNKVAIHFTVPDFEAGVEYVYYFKTDDNEWVFNDKNTVVELGELSTGLHTIYIKTVTGVGKELVIKQQVYIQPPVWKRWWFLLSVAALLLSGIWLLYRRRIRQLKQVSQVDMQIKDLEMKALQVQMNPHFIFNALNSIKELILTDKKEEASRYLSKFGYLVRLNLEQNNQSLISLADNNRQLSSYLEMESLRFRNLNWSIIPDQNVEQDELLIPPMIIQPLVENAIWHGLLPKEMERTLCIRYKKTGDLLYCEIEDNGIGFNQSVHNKQSASHQSVGLANIKNRLELLSEKYNEPYSISIVDKSSLQDRGSGTLAILSFPVKLKNY